MTAEKLLKMSHEMLRIPKKIDVMFSLSILFFFLCNLKKEKMVERLTLEL